MYLLNNFIESLLYKIKGYEYIECGRFKSNEKEFYVYVGPDDSDELHVHVYTSNAKFLFKNINKKYFHTCISLKEPKYIKHKFKIAKFTNKEILDFDIFMHSKPSILNGYSIWEFLAATANTSDIKKRIDVESAEIPEYIKLK